MYCIVDEGLGWTLCLSNAHTHTHICKSKAFSRYARMVMITGTPVCHSGAKANPHEAEPVILYHLTRVRQHNKEVRVLAWLSKRFHPGDATWCCFI